MRVPKWAKWFGGGIILVLVAIVGGTYVYIHFLHDDAPPELTFENIDNSASTTSSAPPSTGAVATTAPAAATGATGETLGAKWNATTDSIFGYRVQEILFGQKAEAYGRTQQVTGSLTISGSTATEATLSVDMASVASDQDRRDDQFRGRIMATSEFPTADFVLTKPADFGPIPPDKTPMEVELTGDLTLRGNTKSVTVTTEARRNGANIEVTGKIPIVFDEWGIPNPSGGPATTEDHGIIEFFVVFQPA